MVRKLGAAFAVAGLLLVSACGGDDVARPSVSEIKKKLDKGDDLIGLGSGLKSVRTSLESAGLDTDIADDATDCVAKALEGSDLSNKALVALLDGDAKAKVDKGDTKAAGKVGEDTSKCLTEATEKITSATPTP